MVVEEVIVRCIVPLPPRTSNHPWSIDFVKVLAH